MVKHTVIGTTERNGKTTAARERRLIRLSVTALETDTRKVIHAIRLDIFQSLYVSGIISIIDIDMPAPHDARTANIRGSATMLIMDIVNRWMMDSSLIDFLE